MPFTVRTFPQQFTVFDTVNSALPDNTVRAVTQAHDGSLWIGTDWGLARLKHGNWTVFNSANTMLPDNSIRSVAVDKQYRTWVGTFLGGLAILADDTIAAIYHTGNSPLPANHVRAIAFDTAGAWIGTTGGLAYIRDTFWQVFDINNSVLRSNNIASLLIDDWHRLWAGTVNGGLVMVEDTAWTLYRNSNSGLPDNTVLGLAHDALNNIWIASPAAGITAFNGSAWLSFNTSNSASPTNSYNAIAVADNNDKYLASKENGLVIYRGGVAWENYHRNNSGLPQDSLLCIAAAADDPVCVWLGTVSRGLVKFCREDTSSTAAASAAMSDIIVFPNPALLQLNILLAQPAKAVAMTVYDASGRRIMMAKPPFAMSFELSLGGLSKGVYLLEIILSEGRKVMKFAKA